MGPNVRRLVGLDDDQYRGMTAGKPTDALLAQFADFLVPVIENVTIESKESLLDLIEELVAMDFPSQAIRLADLNPTLAPTEQPDGLKAIGTACLLTGEFGRAEICFRDAQALDSSDPAPYVNMTQLLYADHRMDEALEWCSSGLDVEPNHRKLWEYLAAILTKIDEVSAPDKVRERATSLNSWAGLSLGCDMQMPGDSALQAEILSRLYDEGERDGEFLTEYTAALGGAGSYDRIALVVLQAERFATAGLPWQLYAHSLQANLARGLRDHAEADLKKLASLNTVPKNVMDSLAQVVQESDQHEHHDHHEPLH